MHPISCTEILIKFCVTHHYQRLDTLNLWISFRLFCSFSTFTLLVFKYSYFTLSSLRAFLLSQQILENK